MKGKAEYRRSCNVILDANGKRSRAIECWCPDCPGCLCACHKPQSPTPSTKSEATEAKPKGEIE